MLKPKPAYNRPEPIDLTTINVGLTGAIVKVLLSEVAKLATQNNPDARHNVGMILGTAYIWDTIEAVAKKQSDKCWKALEVQKLIKEETEPGDYTQAESPHFQVVLKVSKPVERFSPDTLADILKKSKYKIPEPITKDFCEKAKVGTKGSKTYKIVEKGVI